MLPSLLPNDGRITRAGLLAGTRERLSFVRHLDATAVDVDRIRSTVFPREGGCFSRTHSPCNAVTNCRAGDVDMFVYKAKAVDEIYRGGREWESREGERRKRERGREGERGREVRAKTNRRGRITFVWVF